MRVLVAVDGSEYSGRALRYVIALMKRMDERSSIGLVNVHDDTPFRNASHWLGRQSVSDYLSDEADKELADAIDIARGSGIDFEVVKRIGVASEQVVAAATEGEFELIAVGAKGRTGIADLLVGSVAQRVASTSPVPVLTVR